jgi:hypothetical protein
MHMGFVLNSLCEKGYVVKQGILEPKQVSLVPSQEHR